MYCFVKYIDYEQYSEIQKLDETGVLPSTPAEYTNCEVIINPNCGMKLIMNHICKEAGLKRAPDNYDLCSDKGILADHRTYPPLTSGLIILTPRHTYYIVFVEKDEFGQVTKIVPLLNKYSKEYVEFIAMQHRSSLTKKPSPNKVTRRTRDHSSAQEEQSKRKASTRRAVSGGSQK